MRIAICGTRGIPACYGGFETFAEELSTRLVQRGHEVTVYGRTHVIKWREPFYRGVKIKLLPAPRHKYLETPVHSLLSFLHLCFNRVDVALVCNAANSPFLWVLKAARIPCPVNVDGIERKRAKWNSLGRLWYRLGELTSVMFATRLIADADVISEYYATVYGAHSVVLRYGCHPMEQSRLETKLTGSPLPVSSEEAQVFSELGVSSGSYVLYVSRLEPENNAHVVIEAYNRLDVSIRKQNPLLIVGDAPYAAEYRTHLEQLAGPEVIFAGYRFGESYKQLQTHARIYVQATEVGGTHPALVEAMGFGNAVIANNTPENAEVVGDGAQLYSRNDPASLASHLQTLLTDENALLALRRRGASRALEEFDWDKITHQYEVLFRELVRR